MKHFSIVFQLIFSLLVVAVASAKQDEVDPEVSKWLMQLGTPADKNFEALNKLIQLGEKSADPLRETLKDKTESQLRRWQSAMALGRVSGKAAIPDLLTVLNERGRDVEILQRVVIEVLLPIADEGVDKQLKELVEKPETPASLKQVLKQKLSDPKINPRLPDPWEAQFDWSDSYKTALAQARKENKLVMTIVYANQSDITPTGQLDGSAMPYHVLLRGPFTDPDLKALIQNHFVLRKTAWHIHLFSREAPQRKPDPLFELGTNSREIQPPAILFHTSEGKLINRINAIGTFNPRLLQAALTTVLKSSKREFNSGQLVEIPDVIPDEMRRDWIEAKFKFLTGDSDAAIETIEKSVSTSDDGVIKAVLKSLGGKILHHEGDKAGASKWFADAVELGVTGDQLGETLYWLLDCPMSDQQRLKTSRTAKLFEKDNPGSIWIRKIASRLEPTDIYIETAESFDIEGMDLLLPIQAGPRDFEKTIVRALQYLVHSQSADGNWRPLDHRSQLFTQAAVTAICANAIRDWRRDDSHITLSDDLQTGMKKSEAAARQALIRYTMNLEKRKRIDYLQVWNQTYALEYFLDVLRDNRKDDESTEMAQRLVDILLRHQYKEGGWSYLPPTSAERWGGIRPHSFNTAPILIELMEAKRLELKVEQTAIDRAVKSIEFVRGKDGAFAYAPAKGFAWMTRQRCAIARDPLCELALLAAGKKNVPALVEAFERFHRHREDLEIPRKLYTSYFNANGHGSYFFAFGYFYASRTIRHLPENRQLAASRNLQNDLLSIVELDGTWIDSHAQGKPYATGMILRTLFNTNQAIQSRKD